VNTPKFWDALAPYHAAIENNYLDKASARRLLPRLQAPVLVVGAGHGLIVAELRKKGLRCDGIDFSREMIAAAKDRRGLDLIQADAADLPFEDNAYASIIYATGVIDFNGDDSAIQRMLTEGMRVTKSTGRIFVAFYRLSSALTKFAADVGLLKENAVLQRECLRSYLLKPWQMVGWITQFSGAGPLASTVRLLRLAALGSVREKAMTLKMQRIFREMKDPEAFIQVAPEKQPYRDEVEIRRLFARVGVPLAAIRAFPTCWIAELDRAPAQAGVTGPGERFC
jgi:SAM-dependent methyltransferase